MPYVTMRGSFDRTGEATAMLSDLGADGTPDRKRKVPVKIRRISEHALAVDGEPRRIVWCRGGNGKTVFLVDGSRRDSANRERRAALARASVLLNQLRDQLLVLKDGSAAPEFIIEGLGALFEWTSRERERLTAAPRRALEEASK
jgi:hypothetical protein